MGAQNDALGKTFRGVGDVISNLARDFEGVLIASSSNIDSYGWPSVVFGDELFLIVGIRDCGCDFAESQTGAFGGPHRYSCEFLKGVGLTSCPDVKTAGGAVNCSSR